MSQVPTTGGTKPITRGHVVSAPETNEYYNPSPEHDYQTLVTGNTYSFTLPATNVPVYQSFYINSNTTIQGSYSNGTSDNGTTTDNYTGVKYVTASSSSGARWYASDNTATDWVTITPNGNSTYTFADTSARGYIYSNNVQFNDVHFVDERWTAITKEEQEKLDKANKKSMELLKEWLSEAEYNYLMERGELEIPSQIHDDEIYIIKKAAYEKVIKKKAGKTVSKHCLITKGHFPDGDVLLTKILLLKTNEKEFLEKAIMSAVA